jgi:hypothetical protein
MLLVKTGTVQCISMRDVSAVLSTEAISALMAFGLAHSGWGQACGPPGGFQDGLLIPSTI